MLEFLCPNGHRLRCPEAHAGRAAKCPRCRVKFLIPDPSEAEFVDATDGGSGVCQAELTDSGIGPAASDGQDGAAAEEPQIEFLCPNRHRLHGSASLQGRPGQCPECGSKFRIPTYDDVPEEEEWEQQIGVGRADGSGQSGVALPQFTQTGPSAGESPDSQQDAVGHPMAKIFSKLWAERPRSAPVEVHLRDGQTVLPDRFAETLSRQSHGVFAVKEPDGSHTVAVVAWDSVVSVLVRGVEKLPNEMSD